MQTTIFEGRTLSSLLAECAWLRAASWVKSSDAGVACNLARYFCRRATVRLDVTESTPAPRDLRTVRTRGGQIVNGGVMTEEASSWLGTHMVEPAESEGGT